MNVQAGVSKGQFTQGLRCESVTPVGVLSARPQEQSYKERYAGVRM